MATTPATEKPPGSELTLDLPWFANEEHDRWRWRVREFAERVLAPTVAERTIARNEDEELIEQLAELGVFGIRVSKEMDGQGADVTTLCIVLEELSRIDGSMANTVEAAAISASLFEHLATDEQKRDVLPPAARGETFICFGLTEPTGGSDAGNIKTVARRDGGGDWVINGAKQFISNAGSRFARHIVLLAATGEGRPGRPEVSAFLVPLDAAGVEISPSQAKIGWAASHLNSIAFTDVRVPAGSLLGTEGRGKHEALGLVTWARMPLSAMSVGIAQGCLEATLEWVKKRESFGKTLGQHQSVAFDVATMWAKLSAARTVTYDACYRFENGEPFERQASVAKLITSEIANEIAYRATQLHGGFGFVQESAVTRLYGDARVLTIGEGPSEIQKMIIARHLGLVP